MKRSLPILFCLLSLALSLAGCGEQVLPDTTDAKPKPLAPGEKPKDVLMPIEK